MNDESASPLRGDRLQALRKARNLTQTDVAEALNCSVSTVSQMESGARGSGCSLDMLVSLSTFYDVSTDHLLGLSIYTHNLLITEWRTEFDERQRKEIAFNEIYAKDFAHGTEGHNARLIMAKMSALLDK